MNDRIEVLKTLLNLNKPIEEIVAALSKFEWDSAELVILQFDHIKRVLERYMSGEFNELIVENWANTIECRDDIGLPEKAGDFIEEVIHELANPNLTQKLTLDRAELLVKRLRA